MAVGILKEIRIKGIVASPGIAIGRSFKHQADVFGMQKRAVEATQVEVEIERLQKAIGLARNDLEKIREEADKAAGSHLAKIFEAQILILDDSEFLRTVFEDIRRSRLNCDYIYYKHISKTLKSLGNTEDSYLVKMADDIKATAGRVMSYLIGAPSRKLAHNRGKIAIAPSFTPGEVVLMNKYDIPGFATELGGPTSHMVLIAKSLSIPAVVGVNEIAHKSPDDATMIIDGNNGQVIINPTDETLRQFEGEKKKQQTARLSQLKKITCLPDTTKDGHKVELLANVDFPTEIDHYLAAGKIGVGLYRTEFFYLSGPGFPNEEEQTRIYHEIAQTYFPNMVTVRTFDLGSDKVAGDPRRYEEANPALGWRGIRFDLDMPDLFRTQIRAILRASEFRNLKIMLPMVSSASEVVKARRVVNAQIAELQKQKIRCDESIETGIMIEVPSAALMADSLAKQVDFFSIGTNDLTQYTLAVDRGNKKIINLYREFHPAVLRLIKMTVDAGAASGIPVSMCGELAANLQATPLLVGLGLKILSVNPRSLPALSKRISQLRYAECVEMAQKVMTLTGTEKVETYLHDWNEARFSKSRSED